MFKDGGFLEIPPKLVIQKLYITEIMSNPSQKKLKIKNLKHFFEKLNEEPNLYKTRFGAGSKYRFNLFFKFMMGGSGIW